MRSWWAIDRIAAGAKPAGSVSPNVPTPSLNGKPAGKKQSGKREPTLDCK
jgi:hypothetical protein